MAAEINIAVLVISPAGLNIAGKLADASADFTIYAHRDLNVNDVQSFSGVGDIVSALFNLVDGFVFIMASGIAVRTLAPHLTDKRTDPGAVVVDEAGEHVISLVGGHEGGANSLAYSVAAAIGGQPIITTGSVMLKPLMVGVGCRRGTSSDNIQAAILAALASIKSTLIEVRALATIDRKRDEAGLLEAADRLGLDIRFFSQADLQSKGGWTGVSKPALRAFGVAGVCEPAALCGGQNYRLVLPKQKYSGVTIAIAASRGRETAFLPDPGSLLRKDQNSRHCEAMTNRAEAISSEMATDGKPSSPQGLPCSLRSLAMTFAQQAPGTPDTTVAPVENSGSISLVGIGQGNGQMSEAALAALAAATDIVGYKTYIKAIDDLITDQIIHESGMGKELDRARLAVALALEGRQVAVVSSGDSGIYGMAGPVLEVLGEARQKIDVRIIPGITAANAAAAAVGAPLMNDFAVISLSNLLIPWEVIVRRLTNAAEADMVIVLYNPKSRGRQDQLGEACRLIREHRPGETPVAVVRNAGQSPETYLTDLAGLPLSPVDMRSTVIVGNSQSAMVNGWFITKRGYRL